MNSLTFDTRVGPRIKASRERLGLTQAELARRIGVRPETIRDWEGCYGYPSVCFRQAVADALGCSVPWLLDGVGDPPGDPRPVLPHLEAKTATVNVEQPVPTTQITSTPPAVDLPFPTCRCGWPENCHCDPRPEDCGPACSCSKPNELAPETQDPSWEDALAEYGRLYELKKAFDTDIDAKLDALKDKLYPQFSDEVKTLKVPGFSLTRVTTMKESYDTKAAFAGPRGKILAGMLADYRKVTTSISYRATIVKGKGVSPS